MTYRATLLNQDKTLRSDHLRVLTDAQLSKLALWSLEYNQSVEHLLANAEFMIAEEAGSKPTTFLLEGTLPCGLYGAMLSDGSCHT